MAKGSTLKDVQKRIDDTVRKRLDEQAREALQHIRDRTLKGIGTNGRRFKPYAPSTAKRKGRREPVTLRQSLDMMNSLHTRSGGKNRREVVFRDRGRNERIGRYHQYGTRNREAGARRERMPARRWFGLTLRFARQSSQKFGRPFEVITPSNKSRLFKIRISV